MRKNLNGIKRSTSEMERSENESFLLVRLHAGKHTHTHTCVRVFAFISISSLCALACICLVDMCMCQRAQRAPNSWCSTHSTQYTRTDPINYFCVFAATPIAYLTFFFSTSFLCAILQLRWHRWERSEWFVDVSCRQKLNKIRKGNEKTHIIEVAPLIREEFVVCFVAHAIGLVDYISVCVDCINKRKQTKAKKVNRNICAWHRFV